MAHQGMAGEGMAGEGMVSPAHEPLGYGFRIA